MNIQQHISLLPYNTFGIDVSAAAFIEINSLSDLQTAVSEGIFKGKHLILGGGSNMLLGADFDGTVIKNNLKGIEIIKQDADHIWIKAAGGEIWHQLVIYCVDHGFGGIENMSLIPGTVGAAPMQNIGAYGVELTDVFYELTAYDILTGEQRLFSHYECHFAYRSSVFKTSEKGRYFITDVTLRLSKHPEPKISYGAIKDVLAEKGQIRPTIKDVSEAVIAIRSSKLPDPKVLGNAGSFFKNPEIPEEQYMKLKQTFPAIPGYPAPEGLIKVPAGWLIEQCGWKGKRVGNTGAHKDQALVLVNYGGASGAEIMQLATQIQQSVFEQFNITISPEVNLIT